MALYGIPLAVYSVVFCNIRVIFEILAGALSFAFYTPTYLIILNVYALCRMDDLSWGTKGLDNSGGGKDTSILDSWRIIKTIHVGKLVFWNVITAGLLIHFGSDYLIRFYLTFALMVLIGGTMALKVFLAIAYFIYYRLCINTKAKNELLSGYSL
jgi:chitin synthase